MSARNSKSPQSQSHASKRCAASRHCKEVERKQSTFFKTLPLACALLLPLGVTNMTLKLTLRRLQESACQMDPNRCFITFWCLLGRPTGSTL